MRTVLIVDDDPSVRDLLAVALEHAGFTVQLASCGAEALQAVALRRPAAMIVDSRMPGMSGAEVIRRVRATPELEGVGAILATAWCDDPEELDASVLLMEKPFTLRRLVDELQRLVAASKPPAPERPGRAVGCGGGPG